MTNLSTSIEEGRSSSVLLPSRSPTYSRSSVVGAIIGNWLEVFDFTVYATFAVAIGKQFFPVSDPNGQILISLATFGVGYLARPLGSVVIGGYADRAGRKAALSLTILLMACGTGIIAFTPSYNQIGLAAPLLIVLARLLQGFSAGGEIGTATTLLVEQAPAGRRGFFGSWQIASQGLAIATGAVIGFTLGQYLPSDQMESWGWRIPFVFGLLIAPVGMYIRRHTNETAHARDHDENVAKLFKSLFTEHLGVILTGILSVMGATITAYVLNGYMITYSIQSLGMPMATAMLAGIVGGVVTFAGALWGGYLSDRFGRRVLAIWPRVVLLILAYPAFLLVAQYKTLNVLLLVIAVLSTLQAMSGAVGLVILPECFPRKIRVASLSVVYAASTTLFGGTAPIVSAWLVAKTGNPVSIAWYLIIANVATILALFALHPPREDEILN